MPNWTTNKLTFGSREDFERFCDKVIVDGAVDFNRVIPMPDILKNTGTGWRTFTVDGREVECRAWYEAQGKHDTARPFTEEEKAELASLGVDNWYDWAIVNWGTKWNASDTRIHPDKLQVEFYTAWSIPEQVLEKLADEEGFHFTLAAIFEGDDDILIREYGPVSEDRHRLTV